MKQINERHEYRLRLNDLSGAEAWGTTHGSQVFGKINGLLLSLPERTLVAIDFSGINRADVSFLREAVVEIVRKHRPRLVFIAANLSDTDVRSNLESALALRGESLLLRREEGPVVLGKHLPKEHETTLWVLQKHSEFTSGQLTGRPFDLESSTASARLTALWKAGLLDRIQGAAPSGGKEYKYFPVV